MSNPKFVYFVRPVGMDGPIKIGCSEEPEARMRALSPWSPYPLEMIGFVPGGHNDEKFLHQAFAKLHSHREWFHSSPELRATIAKIIAENSVDGIRKEKKAEGVVRKSNRIVRAPEHQRFLDLQAAVGAAQSKLRDQNERGDWHQPLDVQRMVKRWNALLYRGAGFTPTEAELARVQEYLDAPAKHSIEPPWRKEHDARMEALAAERAAKQRQAAA